MDEILLIQQQQQQAVQSSLANGRDTPSSSTDSDQETSPVLPSSPTAPGQGELSLPVKQQQMYIWNDNFEKWHECTVSLQPPHLYIKEHEDTRIEIQDKQLHHHKEKWFHGGISRKEAKVILQDFAGGDGSFLVRISESYTGKFAISFMHEGRVKHVVIETRPDTVAGVLYYITPQGPCFDSLTGLIEEAKRHCIIKNQLFDVVLKKSPPKPDQRWLHKSIKSFSHAEKLMKKETREGSYLVYKTSSDYAPYSLVYR
ncbi:PREDICTED: 1-phosphatidylinositol 4,5-bisphosphate phosphodiesterase gamma-1-like [Amphimedon queenslandica]|uniref:SH2 domain-containing protein n=1 Tax=Amphimedon queenslandica TaxID=400682 RepID=A0AAN0JLC6_AMPQE|nr:PREDICTED: 1-phosphatidylinositol 4,5-bisphosphate phosphodiesterase gamma-1-like [Amphimedon queenslandica]|eukprot:XP_019857797.1 PREDICTED: 1-phosphatidylinositol 4,5-bisphosphate phosphodiesterase gamma-1-like [Amphimedon queenslandica]